MFSSLTVYLHHFSQRYKQTESKLRTRESGYESEQAFGEAGAVRGGQGTGTQRCQEDSDTFIFMFL